MRKTQDVLSGRHSLSNPGTVCVLRFHTWHAAFASSLEISGGTQPAAAPETTPGPLLTSLFSFLLSLSVSECPTGRLKSRNIFFSIFRGTFTNVLAFTKGPTSTDMQKNKKQKRSSAFLLWTLPQKIWMPACCSCSELLYFCRGCFMGARLSHGKMPEKGPFSRGISVFFYLNTRHQQSQNFRPVFSEVWNIFVIPHQHLQLDVSFNLKKKTYHWFEF